MGFEVCWRSSLFFVLDWTCGKTDKGFGPAALLVHRAAPALRWASGGARGGPGCVDEAETSHGSTAYATRKEAATGVRP